MQIRPRRLLAALAATSAVLLVGCSNESAGAERGVTVQDVWDDADRLAGEQVTVSATVQRIVSPRAFVISGGDSGVDPLLVVHDGSAEPSFARPVRVTGTVRQTLTLDTVRVLDDPNRLRELYETYGEEPYLEATAVTPLPEP